jgi:hypothetical protein
MNTKKIIPLIRSLPRLSVNIYTRAVMVEEAMAVDFSLLTSSPRDWSRV